MRSLKILKKRRHLECTGHHQCFMGKLSIWLSAALMQTAHIASIMLALNAGKKIELSGSSRWRRCPYILLANDVGKSPFGLS